MYCNVFEVFRMYCDSAKAIHVLRMYCDSTADHQYTPNTSQYCIVKWNTVFTRIANCNTVFTFRVNLCSFSMVFSCISLSFHYGGVPLEYF